MKIKVFADTICGWCFIGQTRLNKALKNFPETKFEIEHVPFQLNTDMPKEGIERNKYLEIKFGGKEFAQPMYNRMTVPRLPNGMERKAGRAYRSVLDLVVATCTAALAGAMSVVPPDPRRVAGVVPSVSRPCPDVICTGESRRRQRSDVRPVRA